MQKDWKELSEAASREQDPKKLLDLVEKLDHALEECEKAMKEKQRTSWGETNGAASPNSFPDTPPFYA